MQVHTLHATPWYYVSGRENYEKINGGQEALPLNQGYICPDKYWPIAIDSWYLYLHQLPDGIAIYLTAVKAAEHDIVIKI